MATISVVISAYNEEKKIEECLLSVKWADEIIFVDNSSTDATAAIAKKYTKKIFKRLNNPMLNKNKNFGIRKATGDWILYMDADERVTSELVKEIKSVVSRQSSDATGYWIPRKNIIFGKWIEYAGMYPDYQMRFFRRGKGEFPAEHVHEMIEIDGATEYLKENLVHYNFETISQFLYKHIELYAPNEAENLTKKGYKLSYKDAIAMPLSEFLSRFFAREGYRDGLHGLVLSLLFSFYHLVIFAKIWERDGFKEYNQEDFFDGVSEQLKKGSDETLYWIANEKIKYSKNPLEKASLMIERKMKS